MQVRLLVQIVQQDRILCPDQVRVRHVLREPTRQMCAVDSAPSVSLESTHPQDPSAAAVVRQDHIPVRALLRALCVWQAHMRPVRGVRHAPSVQLVRMLGPPA